MVWMGKTSVNYVVFVAFYGYLLGSLGNYMLL
jgi:hypothetical protein